MSLSPFGSSGKKMATRHGRTTSAFEEATLRDFSGGLNLVDNELILKTKFAVTLDNVHRNNDGTMTVRWGTKLIADVNEEVTLSANADIIDMTYFRDKLVMFHTSGEVSTYDGTTFTVIWNETIANALSGSPSGWSSGLTQVDFTEFRNELVVCNGEDKPILIADDHTVTYLQDIPTGSNVYTPIGKYVTTVNNFVCIGGIPAEPNAVYISSQGTSGTWPGDTAPNDSTSFNVDAYAATTGGDIVGLSAFRNYLIVHFVKASVIVQLGTYDGSTHTPLPSDTLTNFGVLSHRMPIALTNDLIFGDGTGIYTTKRNIYVQGEFQAASIAEKIRPTYVGSVPATAANRLKSFSVYNALEQRLMFFVYSGSTYNIYVASTNDDLSKIAWSKIEGWDFDCGTGSVLGRVYFAKGTKLYQYGNDVFANEDYTADFIDDYDTEWATSTAYVVGDRVLQGETAYICIVDHTSGTFSTDLAAELWEEYEGDAIDFVWEMPWTDTNTRIRKKLLGYVGFDTEGTASYSLQIFVDRLYRDAATSELTPALNLTFVGGDSAGYGNNDQPYGGGRRTADERLWGYPVEFKLIKLRVVGSTKLPLSIAAISVLYRRGQYFR